ncbi:MAG: S8 family serine peptidase [Microcoleaceae cyanobacterium]
MRKGQYIILCDTQQPDLGDPFSGRSSAPMAVPLSMATATGGVGMRVEVEELDKSDIADLRRDPEVVSIAPAMPIQLIKPTAIESAETRTTSGTTWGIEVTGAAASPFSGQGIKVAVLDTGIDANHEAFQGVQLVQRDFTGEGDGDSNGHGTHCAGTIFGQAVNGYRFGVAPGIETAIIGKVLGSQGGGSTQQIYEAILWAMQEGAHIISMSLGLDFPGLVQRLVESDYPVDLATSLALEDYRANVRLFERLAQLAQARGAFFQGTLMIAASGNESKRDIDPSYEVAVAPPAAAEGILSVGALQTTGEPHNALTVGTFSNTGPNVSGPGVKIYSAQTGGGYVELTGTSMATPHVAGIAALWGEKLLSIRNSIPISQLSALLVGQATIDRLARDFDPLDVGAGLVQAPLV